MGRIVSSGIPLGMSLEHEQIFSVLVVVTPPSSRWIGNDCVLEQQQKIAKYGLMRKVHAVWNLAPK